MTSRYLIAIGAALASAAILAPQQAAATVAEPAACVELHQSYEEASKRLAMNDAAGLGERSAVRATERQTKNNGILAEAGVTLDLLKANGCSLPTRAPSGNRYYFQALRCYNDILEVQISRRNGFPASCERAKWVPDD